MSNNILIVALVAVALYILSAMDSNAATTSVQPGAGCLQTIQAEYGSQWAKMNTVQRALVGLRASACEGGK